MKTFRTKEILFCKEYKSHKVKGKLLELVKIYLTSGKPSQQEENFLQKSRKLLQLVLSGGTLLQLVKTYATSGKPFQPENNILQRVENLHN